MVEKNIGDFPEKRSTDPDKGESYNPKVISNSLLMGFEKVLYKIIAPLIITSACGAIFTAATVNSGLPLIARMGLGAALGLGIVYYLKNSKNNLYPN